MNTIKIIFPILFYIMLLAIHVNCSIWSLKPPPITFTQTQTASERQMVGDDKDIEKDGWLISSIKSSSSGSDLWQKEVADSDTGDRNHLILLKKLAYLSPELVQYKMKGYAGESFDGRVKRNISIELDAKTDESRLSEVLDKVNRTRTEILEFKIKSEIANNPQADQKQIRNKYSNLYYNSVEVGEYFEPSLNKWKKKE